MNNPDDLTKEEREAFVKGNLKDAANLFSASIPPVDMLPMFSRPRPPFVFRIMEGIYESARRGRTSCRVFIHAEDKEYEGAIRKTLKASGYTVHTWDFPGTDTSSILIQWPNPEQADG